MSVVEVESMMSAFGYPLDQLVPLLLRAATNIPHLLSDAWTSPLRVFLTPRKGTDWSVFICGQIGRDKTGNIEKIENGHELGPEGRPGSDTVPIERGETP